MIADYEIAVEFLRRLAHPVAIVATKPVSPHLPKSTVVWPPHDDAADLACGLSEDYHSIFCNLNPLIEIEEADKQPGCSVKNRLIARRTRVLIDVDGHDVPKETAHEQMEAIRAKLGEPLIATDSGNGYGLLYQCNLPNDPTSNSQIRTYLQNLKSQFPCVDTSVHTAGRLTRVIGTLNRSVVDGSRIRTYLLN